MKPRGEVRVIVVVPTGPRLLHLLLASEASEHLVRQTCDRCLDSYIYVCVFQRRGSEKMSAGINV